MPTVTISATNLVDLKRKLEKIKSYVEWRNSMGFPMFQVDEEWTYATQPDKRRVCPICMEYSLVAKYTGFDIPRFFPSNQRRIDNGAQQTVYPNVHAEHRGEVNGECHCNLTWLHPVETITNRAVRDMEEMIKYG